MSRIVDYEELRRALGLDKPIATCRWDYSGKEEKLEILFADDLNIKRPRPPEIGFKCYDCKHIWGEPGVPCNPNCPACGSENIEIFK